MKRRFEQLTVRRPDLLIVVGASVFAVLALIVLKLASEIAEGEFNALDRDTLLWIRQSMGGIPALRALMLDLTALGDTATLTMICIAAAGLAATLRDYRLAMFLPVHAAIGAVLVQVLKGWVDRGRPDVIDYWTTFSHASFPSGHTANSAIVYLSLAILLGARLPNRHSRLYVAICAAILCVGIGMSRLYLGVHWPTDVLAGWAFGGGWALLGWTISWRLGAATRETLK